MNRITHQILKPYLEGAGEDLRQWIRDASALNSALDEHACVSVTDAQGKIVFVNDRFCALSGYSKEELVGRTHRILKSGHHPKKVFEVLWNTISSGHSWHGKLSNRAKDGSIYWVEVTIMPVPQEGDGLPQYVAIASDITGQIRIETELAKKLVLQKVLADLMARFVALPSSQVNEAIIDAQQTIVEALDLDRSSLWQIMEGEPGLFITHYHQKPGWPPLPQIIDAQVTLPWAFQRVMQGESFHFTSIDELPAEAVKDRETFLVHGPKSNVTIPLTANGKSFGALAFATLGEERVWREDEISELKLIAEIIGNVVSRQRAELKAEQLRSEIAHITRAALLGELAAALAHEITQPLAAILTNAQAAQRFLGTGGIDPKELQSILSDIVRDGKRAGGVIHNLRGMLSKAPLAPETCVIVQIVNEVVDFMHAEFLGNNVKVRCVIPGGLPPVKAVRIELQQVLLNLLLNAIQAMKETPFDSRFIDITAHCGTGSVGISVRDHGCGISPGQLAGIFAPFFTTKSTGLGMGLAICRRLIEGNEGTIEARNHEEGGAVVSLSVPAL